MRVVETKVSIMYNVVGCTSMNKSAQYYIIMYVGLKYVL